MANFPVGMALGKQIVAGTVAAAFTSVPAIFDHEPKDKMFFPAEDRNSQDDAFTGVRGVRWEEWAASGPVYVDTFGMLLLSMFGAPTTAVATGAANTHTFKPTNSPPLLSSQFVNPTQAFQSLDNRLDDLTIKYGGDEDLMWSVKGMGLQETKIGTPTLTYSDGMAVRPLTNWMAGVTLGGSAFARIVSAEFSLKRGVKAFFAGGGRDPNRYTLGTRTASFKAILDFGLNTTDYDATLTSTTSNFVFTFQDVATVIGTSSNPTLTLNLPRVLYTARKPDYSKNNVPLLNVEASKLIYDTTAAAAFYATLTNLVASY